MISHLRFPLRQLATDGASGLQYDFACDSAALLEGLSGVKTEPTAHGLVLRGLQERDLAAATLLLETAFPSVRLGALEIVHLDQRCQEPYVRVLVTTPEDARASLMSRIQQRGGDVQVLEQLDSGNVGIHAIAPLADMLGFDAVAAELTGNRATVDYEFDGYRKISERPKTTTSAAQEGSSP